MKLGFVYAGQGSQYVGMGQSLYENYPECRDVLDQIELDFDYKQLMFQGDEALLNQTAYTQPCMLAIAIMVNELLRKHHIIPHYVCGLSLGEYSALEAAGVFDAATVMKAVRERGKAMEKAARSIESRMCAVLGMEREVLLDLIQQVAGYVTIANYNCPGQLVIAGEVEAVEAVSKKALEQGARRVIPLKTSGPFHTQLLKEASEILHDYFKDITFNQMNIPVIFNTTAQELAPDCSVAAMLEKQVMSPVYFEDSIRYMIKQGVDTIIEIGPGKVLSGFIRKIDRSIKVYQVEDKESFEKLLEVLQ